MGIPIAIEVTRALGLDDYVILHKTPKIHLADDIAEPVRSITTAAPQRLLFDRARLEAVARPPGGRGRRRHLDRRVDEGRPQPDAPGRRRAGGRRDAGDRGRPVARVPGRGRGPGALARGDPAVPPRRRRVPGRGLGGLGGSSTAEAPQRRTASTDLGRSAGPPGVRPALVRLGRRTLARPARSRRGRHGHAHEDAEVGAESLARVDGDLVQPVGHGKVAESAEMAANMPTTWAMIAGQWTPPLAVSRGRPVGPLQLARHVAGPPQRPVDQEDRDPRGDPDDHDVDEVLQVRGERGVEDGVHREAQAMTQSTSTAW